MTLLCVFILEKEDAMLRSSSSIPNLPFSSYYIDENLNVNEKLLRRTSIANCRGLVKSLDNETDKKISRSHSDAMRREFPDFETSQDGDYSPKLTVIKPTKKIKHSSKKKHKHTQAQIYAHRRSSIDKNREFLKSSLNLIDKIRKNPHHPESPRLSKTVHENLSSFCESSTSIVADDELSDYKEYNKKKIKKLKRKLSSKTDEFENLNLQIKAKETEDNQLIVRINLLEKEISILKDHFQQTTQLQKKLDKLLELDAGDSHHSLRNFYFLVLNKLTAFTIGIQSLNSGLVARSTSWKDDLVSQIFIYLNNFTQCVGGAASFFFGAGVILPLVALPFLTSSELAWGKYRDWSKKRDFARASSYLSGGLYAIEERNQNIAYSLTYLLQMQLRYCTQEGAERIIEDWFSRLCYNLMKDSHNPAEDISKVDTLLSTIFRGKETKHTIETYADRKWTTTGLFEKPGVAYHHANKVCYESLYQYDQKSNAHKLISKSEKYGYLFFNSEKEAASFKISLLARNKKQKDSYNWRDDEKSLGPQVLLKDAGEITSPTIIPTLTISDDGTQIPSHTSHTLHTCPPLSPEVQRLNHEVENLRQDNLRLGHTIVLIKEQMQMLLTPKNVESNAPNKEI